MTPAARSLWDAWRLRREEEAFERLVRPHLPALFDLARRVAGPDAEDAVQDALLDLARRSDARPAEVGVAAWLLRSVWLRARTLRRGRTRRARHESAAASAPPPAPSDAPVGAGAQVERALERLEPDDRLVLVLRFLHDLEYREVAHVLGVTENACRVRVHRATVRLRERLGANALVLLGGLPLEAPSEGPAWIASAIADRATASAFTATGGTIAMTTTAKLLGGAAAAVFLLAGAWWGLAREPTSDGGEAARSPVARTSGEPAGAPPTLAGRAGAPAATAPRVAAPPAEEAAEEPDRDPEPGGEEEFAAASLLDGIRKNAAPDFWADPPEIAALEMRGRIVIVRAPSDVQDAVDEYLERRRREALARAGVAPPEGAPDATSAAPAPEDLEALRRRARRILLLDRDLYLAIRALEAGESEDAAARLDAFLALAPSHRLASRIRDRLREHPEGARQLGGSVRSTAFWRHATRLEGWLRDWDEPDAWADLGPLIERIGEGELVCRGRDLVDLLDRGSLTVEADGDSLYEVLREIQIQTHVEIALDGAAWEVGGRRIEGLSVVGGSLREVLDRLLSAVPGEPALGWEANPRCVRIRRRDGERPVPPMRVRYHDVRDLLDPSAPLRVSAPAEGPPTPPVYQAPPPAPVVTPR